MPAYNRLLDRAAMDLSVIVTSYNSPRTLDLCLDSLSRQREAGEIIVADCSPVNPAPALRERYPGVQFLHFPERMTVPRMRWTAFRQTQGSVVAAVEARCIPAPDWCAKLLQAHRNHRLAPGIGGPVALDRPCSPIDTALYFVEYGLYAPPTEDIPSPDLSGANLSYKRPELEGNADLLDAGAWETKLHLRWHRQCKTLMLCGASVSFRNSMSLVTILRQRFSYGRGYAAARVEGRNILARWLYAASTPVLPWLLSWRVASVARRKGLLRPFLTSLGWVLLFELAWSAGELTGYLAGPSRAAEIY